MARRIGLILFFVLLPATAFADPVSLGIAAVAAGIGTTGTIAAGTLALTFSFASAAIGLALGVVTTLLTPKPKSGFSGIKNSGITQQFRQAVSDRRMFYGEGRISGATAYIGVTDANQYLHMVVLLASHEIEEIGEVLIGDISITDDMLDGSNVVNTGRYDDIIRINKHLGSDSQTADANLVSEVGEWTSNHRLQGIAYLYIRMKWDRDKFPSGIPAVSAWVKGKQVTDTRDATAKWSPNVALIANDYLTDTKYGFSTATTAVDTTALNSAANTCEEYVTVTDVDYNLVSVDTGTDLITLTGDRLYYQTGDKVRLTTTGTLPTGLSLATDYYVIVYQRKDTPRILLATSLANCLAGTAVPISGAGSGTHTATKIAEPRYFGGGVVQTAASKGNNLAEMINSMAGQAVYAGGAWRFLAGEYQTPTISFNDDDLVGEITVQTKISRKERFNSVQGVYITQLNDGNPADYPQVTNATYVTEDGDTIRQNIDFAYTQRPHTAQRIAKIYLERMRQEISFTARFKLTAFKVQVGDNFNFTFDRYSWSSKVFEVVSWSIENQDGTPVIEMTCRENASAVYDWNNGEETQVDPAENTSLPSPFDVNPPTSLVVTPIEIGTAQGDLTYEFNVAWTPPTDIFVTNGGWYEVQFKRTAETEWRRSFRAEDNDNNIRITQVQPAINYDVRIRSVNNLNVRSNFTTLSGFTVSSPSGATVQLDYLTFQGAGSTVTETLDYGLFSEAVDNTLDYGDFV